MKPALTLNLGLQEYLTAVRDQPKPLIIPLCAELPLPDISPLDLFISIRKGYGFLLESMEGSEKIARYSYIGIDPEFVITIGDTVDIQGNEPFTAIVKNPEGETPVDQIKSILSRFGYINVKAPRFFGGMVGYFAYDCVYSLFRNVRKGHTNELDSGRNSDFGNHTARFMLTKDCIVFDHAEKKLYIFSSPFLTYDSDPEFEYEQSFSKILALQDRIAILTPGYHAGPVQKQNMNKKMVDYISSISQEAFEVSVKKIQEYIAAGDIFQAVLSRRIECAVTGDPFAIYAALREINPSPYMYYIDFGDEQVIGASPEMLVRVEKRRVTTVPIAGTRPRGTDAREDAEFEQDLLADPKERAEHTMLVDLARNDLGRVCRFGSVEVEEFMGIEKFSHVQHIVSTIRGMLNDNLDCYDAFKSSFPAGTVSGAPKIRAMQIIDEEETRNRGPYAGAVGYIGFDRNLEFAIAIRTVIVRNGRAYVQVGAGIVADSIPEREWAETESKAFAMLRAIERAGVLP
ncbi:MAG: anthranilate synthase component I [Methanoregula sp.]